MKKINSTITTDVKLKKISFLKLQAELKYHKGFTLIELMVATAISIIVLLAASSAFITTFSLNREVKQRINYENDVRNTADLLRTDLRGLGSFVGCRNLYPEGLKQALNRDFPSLFIDNYQFISTTNIPEKMINSSLAVNPINSIKPLTVLHEFAMARGNSIGFNCAESVTNTGEASIYLVGTTSSNTNPGLYRFVGSGAGLNWQEPELLVSNVQDMSLTFYYDKHTVGDCPQSETKVEPDLEKLTDIDTKYPRPPILVEVNLSVCRSGKFKENKCEEEVNNYVIQAMVRKGEFCI